MNTQLTMDITDTIVRHELTEDERHERDRLHAAGEYDRQRRADEREHSVQQHAWRRRAEESARRRSLTPEQRQAEDATRADEERVQAMIDYADKVECLVLDAERARAYLALEAAGYDRTAKLVSVCSELRADLDAETWERWCALAGLDVERANAYADASDK